MRHPALADPVERAPCNCSNLGKGGVERRHSRVEADALRFIPELLERTDSPVVARTAAKGG